MRAALRMKAFHISLHLRSKKMNTAKLLIAAAAIFATHTASAIEACDRYTTSYDRTYCASKLFVESDAELNKIYKELRQFTKGGTDKELVQTQRDWIKHRNASCESNPGTINVNCNYRLNRERTEYLRDRLRECRTGSCNASAITRPSW